MKYDISKPTAPKMPDLGRGTECINSVDLCSKMANLVAESGGIKRSVTRSFFEKCQLSINYYTVGYAEGTHGAGFAFFSRDSGEFKRA